MMQTMHLLGCNIMTAFDKAWQLLKGMYPEMGPTQQQILQHLQRGFRKPFSQIIPTNQQRRQKLFNSLTPEEQAVLMEQAKRENIQPYDMPDERFTVDGRTIRG